MGPGGFQASRGGLGAVVSKGGLDGRVRPGQFARCRQTAWECRRHTGATRYGNPPFVVMSDFVYKNAPLVEVLAELHWELEPLESLPNAAIDPFYKQFCEQFLKNCEIDPSDVTRLVSADAREELFPDQPHLRLQPDSSDQRLVQIGPGVMTINIIPPYNGWNEFRKFIERTMDVFYKSYPAMDDTFRPIQTHLQYIDVFDEKHGFDNYARFVESHLGVPRPVQSDFVDEYAENPDDILFFVDSRFAINSPADSHVRTRVAPGKSLRSAVAIAEFHCEREEWPGHQPKEVLLAWYDEAHEILSAFFDKTISPELKIRFGEKTEISV